MNEPHEENPVTPTPEATPSTPQPTTTIPVEKVRMNKKIAVALGTIVLGAIAFGAYYALVLKDGDAVAIVNGEKISKTEYDESVTMITQTAIAQGMNPEDLIVKAEIEKAALETLINNALLLGAARDAGAVADKAKIEEQFTLLVEETGGEEAFAARVAEVGITEEKLRENISDRLLVDAYIESATDIEGATSTADEVGAYYESLKASGQELPPLEEIAAQIGAMLINQKQQEIVNGLIAKLRAEAEVTIVGE